MSIQRILCVGLTAVAVLVVSISTEASATTAGWMVNGTLLSGSAALATTAKTHEPWLLGSGSLNIQCSGNVNAVKPEIKSAKKGAASSYIFTACSTTNGGCSVPTSMSTGPVLAEATLNGALGITLVARPETGTLFTTVPFTGEMCAIAGNKPITGKGTSIGLGGQDERVFALISLNIPESAGELFMAGSAASVKGSSLVALQSGQTWSFL
jgi:hypothetical protein